MDYQIFKLKFLSSVHFGSGGLTKVQPVLYADTIFSALCTEALKNGVLTEFLSSVKRDRIRISDGLPYIGSTLYIPKPLVKIEYEQDGDSAVKKAVKRLEYIPIDKLDTFLKGELDIKQTNDYFQSNFGSKDMVEKAAVYENKDAEPYAVGTFTYRENSGLYICVGYEGKENLDLVSGLLESLSYSGIGGERSSGYGRFDLIRGKMNPELFSRLTKQHYREYISLSVSLPVEDELESVLEDARFQMIKRSGYVYSENYSESFRKKRDCFLMVAGSVFKKTFSGEILDVSDGGSHPVYRYAKSFLLGVR